jgi:hypothetical protein
LGFSPFHSQGFTHPSRRQAVMKRLLDAAKEALPNFDSRFVS